jgi:acetyltransferase-like isoleucine patch superfamily enzyme
MRVGRYCSIAGTVISARANHPIEALTTHPALYDPAFGVVGRDTLERNCLHIEDGVWIGHNALILPGCSRIGRGAIVGAGSVVTRDVPPYAVVAGNPARKLRDRFTPDLVAAIEASEWWRMDLRQLAAFVAEHRELAYHPTVEGLLTLEPRQPR